MIIKTQENFDSYSPSNLYNILKIHENEVKELSDEKDKMHLCGPFAPMSKKNVTYMCFDEEENVDEEDLIVNSYDEVVAYYSNNNVKKFYKKSFKGNFKGNTVKKASSTSNHIVENKKQGSYDEKKVDKRLVGGSGYDCNYCNDKNHLARDSMLKRMEEMQRESER